MFSRIRPAGAWNTSTIDPSEMEAFDAQLADAIDGGAGGPYEPGARITIGGAGLEVTSDFQSSGTATMTHLQVNGVGLAIGSGGMLLNSGVPGLVVSAGGANVTGNSEFHNDVIVDGTLFVNGIASFQGIAGFESVVNMNAQVNCAGEVNVGGTLGVAGPTVCSNTLAVTGHSTLQGTDVATLTVSEEIVLGVNARIRNRLAIATVNGQAGGASQTFSKMTADAVMFAGGVMVGDVEWRIDPIGATEGSTMHVSRVLDQGNPVVRVVNDFDSSLIITLQWTAYTSALLIYHSGSWKILHQHRA
jgi:hypothetical protein